MGIPALILGATAVMAIGQYKSGNAQNEMAKFNANVAEQNALNAKQWSEYREERNREQQRYRRGSMLTNFLRSGFTVDEGQSSGIVLEEQAIQDEFDSLSIRRAGEAEYAQGMNQAAMYRYEGKQRLIASRWQMAGTILTGVAAAQFAAAKAASGGAGGAGSAGAGAV